MTVYRLHSHFILALLSMCALIGSSSGCARSGKTVSKNDGLNSGEESAKRPEERAQEVIRFAGDKAHEALFAEQEFPSAQKCRSCHEGHYREWSVSPHAYALLSPVFNAMSSTLVKMTSGTLGDFCIRCHSPVGSSLGELLNRSVMDRYPVSREGITCVVCHRINQAWGKGAGRQSLVRGDIHQLIFGPVGNDTLEQGISYPDQFGVMKTDRDSTVRGHPVHRTAERFFQLDKSGFCGACHDVFAPSGFRLEDAFSEFKASPAALKKQQSCQDCHMGKVDGVASGYRVGPAALVGGKPTPDRKRTDHMFPGPDYSIVHPAFFPHNPLAIREEDQEGGDGLATMRQWLKFKYEEGWGTDAFEDDKEKVGAAEFTEPWDDPVMRNRAREILNQQFALLKEAEMRRHAILSTGYQLGEIEVSRASTKGISFRVKVKNGIDGHGVPTGFDAERVVFLRVTVKDQEGTTIFQSGHLDPNGDLRDDHSVYVHNGELSRDKYLFSLQSKFITRNIRGGEREQVLAVPFSLDPLPYVRPATRPFTVLGRPLGSRKHKQNIEPNGYRWAGYEVKSAALSGKEPYTVNVKLITGMVPVNLVHEISKVGFDYGMSPRKVADRIVKGHVVLAGQQVLAGHQVLHERDIVVEIRE